MRELRLFRDVLDSQIMDRNGQLAGKVDGLVVELPENGPPIVVALESGFPELMRRISPRLGDWIAAVGRTMGVRDGDTFCIPFSSVRGVGINVDVDFDVTETPIFAWETWLRDRVMRRIPGSGT